MAPSVVTTLLNFGELDDNGWSAAAEAVHHVAAERFAAVLTGAAPTTTLPAPAACAVARRLAGRDIAALEAATCADDRVTVTAIADDAALGAMRHRAAVDHALASVREALSGLIPEAAQFAAAAAGALRKPDLPDDVYVDVLLEFFAHDLAAHMTPAGPAPAAIASVAAVLLIAPSPKVAARFATRVGELAPQPRAAAVTGLAAALVRNTNLPHVHSAVTTHPDDLLAALTWLLDGRPAFDNTCKTYIDKLARLALAASAPLSGPGSLAAAFGAPDLASAPEWVVDRCLNAAANHAPAAAGLVDAVLIEATAGGVTPRDLDDPHLNATSPTLPAAVAFAASARAAISTKHASTLLEVCAGQFGHRWAAEEADAALAANAALAAALAERAEQYSHGGLPLPAWVRHAAQRRTGLAQWIDRDPATRTEFAEVTAGLSADRWTVAVKLLGDFHGTPAELVELTAELAEAH